MAERIYTNRLDTQDSRAYAIKKSFEEVSRLSYAGAQDDKVGSRLWGAHTLNNDGLHNEMLYHTGLIGQAAKLDDDVRQRFPTAGYETGSILVRDYSRGGIAYEYYEEDLEDILKNMSFITELVGELGELLADLEEDEYHFVYNNAETYTGGLFNTPLAVDGTNDKLQLLGRPTFFSGKAASNIIYGGVSYALFTLINQYGDNFINEEGRRQRINPAMYVCSNQNADLIELYYASSFNIESGNTNDQNPLRKRPAPTIVRSERMANKNDIWVFFEGWQEFLKERHKYRGREDSWVEGHAQFAKTVTQLRSRWGHYFISNRLFLLVKGAA
jgi:hypothetical protein